MLKVVVLISGGGSNLEALLAAASAPGFPARIVAVGSDTDAAGLAHAERAGVPTFVVRPRDFADREAWGAAFADRIRAFGDPAELLVVSAGLMRVLPAGFVREFSPRLINTHPALLPLFPGAHAVRDALAAGATETGVTVHVIDEGVDTGPVLRQATVAIVPGEAEPELHERIKQVERPLLVDTVRRIALGELRLPDPSPREPQRNPMAVQSHDPSLYEHRDLIPVRRALLSVSDKSRLLELAAALVEAGVEIVSTGSTAATIRDAGHPVTDVAEVTGFAEALDGRVKTLHPAVHSGLLADLRLADHRRQLDELGFAPFELVVVNLYPFEQTVAAGKPAADVIENVDIGGPAMVRATAKNHANAAIVVSPARYDEVIAAVRAGGTTLELRRSLATEAFVHTAQYDAAVANWFLEQEERGWSADPVDDADESDEASIDAIFDDADATVGYEVFGLREAVLRYGENSHQRAALFTESGGAGIAQATQLHGKEMSYNNYVDADAALRAAYDHDRPAVAIIKHANPCGIAVAPEGAADPIAAAHELAHACDPVSAFGGVIAANRVVTKTMAETVSGIFTEVVVAPGFEPEALAILTQKKNVRLLVLPADFTRNPVELRQVSGGFLLQDADRTFAPAETWTLAAGQPADAATLADLEFAWRACRAVKSNAILLANDGASVGVGMGQVNRVDSCRLAVSRAGDRARGAVAASDAFFPFADGLEVLLDAGVRAVVQPGGSVRDEEVIAAANAAGVTMYLTGERHFFH